MYDYLMSFGQDSLLVRYFLYNENIDPYLTILKDINNVY